MLGEPFVQSFASVALSPDPDLAVAALMIARIEYPRLDASVYLDRLDELGRQAASRIASATRSTASREPAATPGALACVVALNDFLFVEEGFVGNQMHYEDPRNSFLNEVLDRRTGIPITLALVYMEVARRAGVQVEGINFPGHFLVRAPAARHHLDDSPDLIIDAFHGGVLLSEEACRELLRRHVGEGSVDTVVLTQATKPQILVRMLTNLKRTYMKMHSLPQARAVIDLLLAVNPAAVNELRDRGLIADEMHDFSAALRDLQAYLNFAAAMHGDKDEHAQIWERVKSLKRRVASLN
jgi:regulator of sirC expression with transglutaminase-like and TPR domain